MSDLDNQSKFQMFMLFSGRHIGVPRRYTNMALHTGLYKFVRNISTNI